MQVLGMTVETTINIGNIIVIVLASIGGITAWMRFSKRVDRLEYKVETVEKTLEAISDTLKKIADTEMKMALMDRRQLAIEDAQAQTLKAVEGLRRGEGYITGPRRGNLEGEYSN